MGRVILVLAEMDVGICVSTIDIDKAGITMDQVRAMEKGDRSDIVHGSFAENWPTIPGRVFYTFVTEALESGDEIVAECQYHAWGRYEHFRLGTNAHL